jgi:hypothetical protein
VGDRSQLSAQPGEPQPSAPPPARDDAWRKRLHRLPLAAALQPASSTGIWFEHVGSLLPSAVAFTGKRSAVSI